MRINTKICTKCSERKPEDQFNEYEPGKKRNICKTCQRSHNVNWETENQRRHEAGLESYPEVKTCYKCKTEKTRDHFTKDWTRKDGLYSMCKECAALKSSRIYKANQTSENLRRYRFRVLSQYGITLEQKEQMFNAQNRSCAVCKSSDVGKKIGGKNQTWPVDHDHKTGKVREILCNPCNLVLGLLGDSVGRLKAMIEYLEKHQLPANSVGISGASHLPPIVAA